MMKQVSVITFLLLVVASFNCATQKRVEYVIPEEYTGQTRANLEKMLQQGQTLYKINCSRCHGIFTNGKDSIPNFSKTQIEAYKSSALLDDPKNHSVAQRIRTEDLDLILQFLSFRRQPSK